MMSQPQVDTSSSGAELVRTKRPYTRRNTVAPVGVVFPQSPPQISGLAFNIHGWALEDGMNQRQPFEVINAYKATMVKGGFEAKIDELIREGKGPIYREDLNFTARETDPTLPARDSAVAQYLIVGYSLQEHDPIFVNNKTFARFSEGELVGETTPSPHHMIQWNHCRTPMLVVTPVKENTGTSVRLFALILPKSGLCQPVLITHERIFYRWEFRASAGARSTQRNKNWNSVVVEKAKMLAPPGCVMDNGGDADVERPAKRSRSTIAVKQEKEQGEYISEAPETGDLEGSHFELYLDIEALLQPSARIISSVTVDGEEDPGFISHVKVVLSSETRDVLTAICASRTDRVLQEVYSLLNKVEVPRDTPFDKSATLQQLNLRDVAFGPNEANAAVEEIKCLWPVLGPIADADKISRIKKAIDDAHLLIGVEMMESFFTNALGYLSIDPNISDENLPNKCYEFISLAGMLHQSHVAASSNVQPLSMDAAFLITLLRDLARYAAWMKGIAPVLEQNRPLTPYAYVEQALIYVIEPDIAAMSEELSDTVEELVANARNMNGGIEDVFLWLERLRLRIRQA